MRAACPIVLALGAPSCSDGGDGLSSSVDPAAVVEEERVIVDTTRPTRANNSAPASDRRTLATRLWYAPAPLDAPACRSRQCALVLLAHGLGGRTSRFDAIARRLAAAGYVVAAPAFPLTNQDTPGGHFTGLDDVVQQPADLSAVIDALLAASADPGDALYRRLDGERIGAVGHSLGGTTVIAATRTECCTDPRLDATVVVAPAVFLTGGFFGVPNDDGPPTLLVNGSDDVLVPPDGSRDYARSLAAPWYYLEIAGAEHVFLIENIGEPQPPLQVTARAALAFFDEYLGGAGGRTAAVLEALAAEGQFVEHE